MDQKRNVLDSEFYLEKSGTRGFSLPIVNSIPPMPPAKSPRKEDEPDQRSEKSKADTCINNKECPCLREEGSAKHGLE